MSTALFIMQARLRIAMAGDESGFIDLVFEELSTEEMNSRAKSFYKEMDKRRTTRHFSTRKVSRMLIEAASRASIGHEG